VRSDGNDNSDENLYEALALSTGCDSLRSSLDVRLTPFGSPSSPPGTLFVAWAL